MTLSPGGRQSLILMTPLGGHETDRQNQNQKEKDRKHTDPGWRGITNRGGWRGLGQGDGRPQNHQYCGYSIYQPGQPISHCSHRHQDTGQELTPQEDSSGDIFRTENGRLIRKNASFGT